MPLDSRHLSNDIATNDLHISRNMLVMHNLEYAFVRFAGTVKPEIQKAFKQYIHLGLKDRTPDKIVDAGKLIRCTHLKPVKGTNASTRFEVFSFLFITMFYILYLLEHLNIVPIDMKFPSGIFLLLVSIHILLIFKNYRIPFSPKWKCTSQSLSFIGSINKRIFTLQDITSLEFNLIPYRIQLIVNFENGTVFSAESKRFTKLLPLYDSIVHYRPELRIGVNID